MNKFLALLLCCILILPLLLIAQSFPPLSLAGVEIPGNGVDDDGDATIDEVPATSIIEDSAAAGNYHFHFKDCEKIVWTNAADPTFPNSIRVEKPTGTAVADGEIACYIPNLPANTYTMHMLYSSPGNNRAVWFGINKPMRYNLKVENASILASTDVPQWVGLIYTGTAQNYYAGANGGDTVSFVWPGGPFTLVFRGDEARYACGYLSIGATSTRICPGETGGGGGTYDYQMYELGKEAVPTAYNSPAFNNALPLVFSGAEIGVPCNSAVVVKGLWQNTTVDKHFWSITCSDTDAIIITTTNDNTSMPAANEDGVDIRWRKDLSAVFDTDTYMVKGNLQPVYFDADWSGTANARNPAVNLTTTVVRNIVAGVSWNMFIASDIGFTITPNMIGLFNLGISEFDTGGVGSFKYFKGSGITDISQYGRIKWSDITVPASGGGGADTTPPVVTNPNIPTATVEQSSFIMTADTNEQSNCVLLSGTSSGNYTLTPTTGSPSVNGVCTQAKTGLASNTHFYAVMQVCDLAGLCTNSAERDTITKGTAPPSCTKYAGNTAQGSANGSSDANRYLIEQFWKQGHAVPGAILCLASGTYKGSGSMIAPPAGTHGNSLNPITIKATVDGGPWLHGESARRSIYFNDNDWWIVEGVDASDSIDTVVAIGGGTTNSIIRRVCAWNGNPTANVRVFGVSGSTTNNILIEDSCGFGPPRNIVQFSAAGGLEGGGGPVINAILRRFWGSFTEFGIGGPNSAFQFAYDSNQNTLENVIGTWKQTGTNTNPKAIFNLANEGQNHKILGSLGYIRAGDTVSASHMFGTDWQADDQHGPVEIRDVILYTEQSAKKPFSLQSGNGTCINCTITNTTEIGSSVASTLGAFVQSNRRSYTDITAANADDANPFQSDNSTTRARMCFRYGGSNPFVGGVLTTTKLWPWPMDSRINAALARAGKSGNDYFGTGNTLTTFLESKFGTISSGCKS